MTFSYNYFSFQILQNFFLCKKRNLMRGSVRFRNFNIQIRNKTVWLYSKVIRFFFINTFICIFYRIWVTGNKMFLILSILLLGISHTYVHIYLTYISLHTYVVSSFQIQPWPPPPPPNRHWFVKGWKAENKIYKKLKTKNTFDTIFLKQTKLFALERRLAMTCHSNYKQT